MYKVLLEQVSERLNEIYKDVEATVQDCEYERLQTGSDILERIVYERLRDIQEIDSKSMEYYSLVEKLESLIPIQEQIKILLNDLPTIFKDFFENEDKSEEETNETLEDLLRKACGNQNTPFKVVAFIDCENAGVYVTEDLNAEISLEEFSDFLNTQISNKH